MTAIRTAETGRITIAEAKRLIIESSRRESFIQVYRRQDGTIEAVPDAEPKSIFAGHLDEDFAPTCEQLGIVPRWKYRPSKTGYTGDPENDELYTITRDELSRLGGLFGLSFEDATAPMPEFREEARPRRVDPELLALLPERQVLFHSLPGHERNGRMTGPASRVVVQVEEQITRQAKGFFTLEEAAHILANANAGCDVGDLIRRMMAAKVKGRRLPREPGSKLPVLEGADSFTFLWVATPEDIDAWLAEEGAPYRFPNAPEAAEPVPVKHEARPLEDWKELAREEARKIIRQDAGRDLYAPQQNIADRIAADFRSRKPPIVGAGGKPMTGATIKRHALKGIDSTVKKAQSTKMGRGK